METTTTKTELTIGISTEIELKIGCFWRSCAERLATSATPHNLQKYLSSRMQIKKLPGSAGYANF
jgi:hypothetical protein